jgi:23S rRNA (cytosine1962-C5)-methyltransferase
MKRVAISLNAAKSMRRGFSWCYRTEVLDWPQLEKGEIVEVVDAQKNLVGLAFSASTSPIALRLITRNTERIDDAFFETRIRESLARRSSLKTRDAYRVVHGEADVLPGLFVDRYADVLSLQTLSEGASVRRELFASLFAKLISPRLIVARDDASGREFEGLVREKRVLTGTGETRALYREGDIKFDIDVMNDSKTGSFLDQTDNHIRAGELGHGTALDTFSYHGGFALALSKNCKKVIAVEQDETATTKAKNNVQLNGLENVEIKCANAFDVLHQFVDEKKRFDTVVIDPPGLAKRKEGVQVALKAYHELNLRAFQLVANNGLLVTCSCSGKLNRTMFETMILEAASDAKRHIQIIERRGAGIDHPVLPALPETEYLKAWFVRVIA